MSKAVLIRLTSLFALVSLVMVTRWAAYAAAGGAYAQSTTRTITPLADTYVIQTNPSANYGTAVSLRVDGSPVTRSYVRFRVQNLNGASIQAAQLRFYANSSAPTGFTAYTLADNTWTETGLTYSNAPVPGTAINSSKPLVSGTWAVANVSSYVRGEGTFDFVLATSGSTALKMSSRETTRKPQLMLTLGPVPTATKGPTRTPTPRPTATNAPAPTATGQPSSDWQPSFPIRAAFYYPWFPEAWTQLGIFPYTNYQPKLGYYSSRDASVLQQHLDMMSYANIDAGIASWWGQGSQTDSKIAGLLQAAAGTHFRWALYYENESQGDPSVAQIQSDLTYIRDHYGQDPSFLRVNGKFVVFVYAAGNDACGMADRWKSANTVGAYVVLKVFAGYLNCASQPDSWHQYSPAVAADQQGRYSYSISPGFWLKGASVRLARDLSRWQQNVKDMAASGANWQLVTTFSEWGEGTAVEPAVEWASTSGYGQYLDALHSVP